MKINPVTYEAEVVCDTPNGDSFGLTFRPTDPNVLYVACWSNMTGMANSIAKVDLNKDKPEMEKLTSGITGHRDGKIAELGSIARPSFSAIMTATSTLPTAITTASGG